MTAGVVTSVPRDALGAGRQDATMKDPHSPPGDIVDREIDVPARGEVKVEHGTRGERVRCREQAILCDRGP